jgi:4-diphosphocytidyl-2-C-methyl-D-erythritol kinase
VLIEERARAKINLTLKVLGQRADGYHELASVVAFASAADRVVLDVSRPPGVDVIGPFAPQLPSEVLIARTLTLLATREPHLKLGAVTLDKRLPVAAGVGGGSADAAAVLRAVRNANPDSAAQVDWHGIAKELGADVPVCLENRLTYMTGIGDRLQPRPPLREPIAAVLINPQVPVPADKTAQVFKALAAPELGSTLTPTAPLLAALPDISATIRSIGNDLEEPARRVMPVVGDVMHALRKHPGCRIAAMSGAGPTCFGLFADAFVAATQLKAAHPSWWIEAVTLA